MKDVIIVGAGGFGREILSWTGHHPDRGKLWEVAGFIDDNPDSLRGFSCALPVLGSITDYTPDPNHLLIMALGNPQSKKAVAVKLLGVGAEFMTFVHPSAILGNNISLGCGVVICPRCVLTSDIVIGNFAMFNVASGGGHDVRVGDYCTISGGCDLTGGVVLEEGAFLGSHVSIIPGKRVGAWAKVGAGSVVVSSVKGGTTVFGNPAKRLL